MRPFEPARRWLTLVLVLFAALGMQPAAAQDEGEVAPTEELVSSVYVSVGCAFDAGTGSSVCTFTPISADGAVVDSLTIPLGVFCAPVVSLGSAVWGDAGVVQSVANSGTSSATLTIEGAVSAGGGSGYGAEVGGSPVEAAGDALFCEAAGAEPVLTDDSVAVDEEAGGEATEDGGTEDAASEAAEEAAPAEEDVAEAVILDIGVSVLAYDCLTDPGVGDPAANPDCTPSQALGILASVDGASIGSSATDAGGVATFAGTAAEGGIVAVDVDLATLPAGYNALGSGHAEAVVSAATTQYAFTFVNLAEPLIGYLQIASGTCKSATESGWAFVKVIEPRISAAAVDPDCAAVAGARFTVTGGTLGAGIIAVTDADGSWPGHLPQGDYTVTAENGAAVDATVLVDETTVVLAVDYVHAPLAVLIVSRYSCAAETAGFEISFSGSEPSIGDDDGCAPVDGEFVVEPSGEVAQLAEPERFWLGSDGHEEVTLEPGSYTLTDLTTGEHSGFEAAGGASVFAVVQDIEVVGGGGGEPGGGEPGGGEPGGGDPGDGTAGGTPDGSGGGGGTNDGEPAPVGAATSSGGETAVVTTLPQTGVRAPEHGIGVLMSLYALLVGVAGVVTACRFGSRVR